MQKRRSIVEQGSLSVVDESDAVGDRSCCGDRSVRMQKPRTGGGGGVHFGLPAIRGAR